MAKLFWVLHYEAVNEPAKLQVPCSTMRAVKEQLATGAYDPESTAYTVVYDGDVMIARRFWSAKRAMWYKKLG